MTVIPNSPHARDIANLVHQQSDLHQYREEGGTLMAKGDGVWVFDEAGNRYLEAMAGLWCASLGFSEKRLAEAAYRQMLELPYYHTFFQKGHLPSVDLAEKLLSIAPDGMSKALFQCSGSEANDAAIKLVWYYHNAIGKPEKKKIIGRERGYHGNTVAAVSVSGQPHMVADFDLPLPGFFHAENPNYYRFHEEGESEADQYIRSKHDWTARTAVAFCEAMETDYALAEGGAVGPTFAKEGLTSGFTVLCVAGRSAPGEAAKVLAQRLVRSDHAERGRNMQAFAEHAAELLCETIGADEAAPT